MYILESPDSRGSDVNYRITNRGGGGRGRGGLTKEQTPSPLVYPVRKVRKKDNGENDGVEEACKHSALAEFTAA